MLADFRRRSSGFRLRTGIGLHHSSDFLGAERSRRSAIYTCIRAARTGAIVFTGSARGRQQESGDGHRPIRRTNGVFRFRSGWRSHSGSCGFRSLFDRAKRSRAGSKFPRRGNPKGSKWTVHFALLPPVRREGSSWNYRRCCDRAASRYLESVSMLYCRGRDIRTQRYRSSLRWKDAGAPCWDVPYRRSTGSISTIEPVLCMPILLD